MKRRRSDSGPTLMPGHRKPPEVAKAMRKWQRESRSQGEPPSEYSEWQQRLAYNRLNELYDRYGVIVMNHHIEYDEYAGMGGMPVVRAVVRTNGNKYMRIQWSDTNRDFMIETEHGGWRASYEQDWVLE